MPSFLQRVILIALILSIVIQISTGHKKTSENKSDWKDDSDVHGEDLEIGSDDSEIGRYLRDLCSNTKKPKQCWKIIEREKNRFTDTNSKNVADIVIDLAIAKSIEISELLNQLQVDSEDNLLKEKYASCWNNYDEAHHNLEIAKRCVGTEDYGHTYERVSDVVRELKSCMHQFGKKEFDPAHIRNRNNEFRRYVEIVRTATQRFMEDVVRNY